MSSYYVSQEQVFGKRKFVLRRKSDDAVVDHRDTLDEIERLAKARGLDKKS